MKKPSATGNAHRPDESLRNVLAEFQRRREAGESVTVDDLIAAHPGLARPIQDFFSNETQFPDAACDETQLEAMDRSGGQTCLPANGFDRETAAQAAKWASDGGFPRPFGRYQLENQLGRGAMGVVYLAVDRQVNRKVAIKTPQFDFMANADALSRFYREARAAATLHHPNICPVYDVGEIDGQHYIAMAYIDGKPLEKYTATSKRQNVRQVVRLVRKLAIALQEAHQNQVVHRDLKPANVMIDDRGEPIIMDFGLARWTTDEEECLTQTGAFMGTPAYMSPEQVSGQQDRVGPQSDIFSLGIIFYELLSGMRPFSGDLISIIRQIAEQDPPPLSTVRLDLDQRVESVCMRMLAKSLEDRFKSMQDVADELTEILASSVNREGPVLETAADSQTKSQGEHLRPGLNASHGRMSTESAGANAIPTGLTIREPSPRELRVGRAKRRRAGPSVASVVIIGALAVGAFALLMRSRQPPIQPERRASIPARLDTHPQSATESPTPDTRPAIVENGPELFSGDAPPVATSPFDAITAKRLQQDWAAYLNLPVEFIAPLRDDKSMAFVLIPPGKFTMGLADRQRELLESETITPIDVWVKRWISGEQPSHPVEISRPFYMAKFEITRGQWNTVLDRPEDSSENNKPITGITFFELQSFVERLNKQHSQPSLRFEIPTEAQWEYACRAGTEGLWYSGDSVAGLKSCAWFDENANGALPVGQLTPNAFGLFDMLGNASEWCADFYSEDTYTRAPSIDPTGPSEGDPRVIRGMSYFSPACQVRCSFRDHRTPDSRDQWGGRMTLAISDDWLQLPLETRTRPRVPDTRIRRVIDEAQDESLASIEWHSAKTSSVPSSRPLLTGFPMILRNDHQESVKVSWVNEAGQPQMFYTLAPGARKQQATRQGDVWLITDNRDRSLGHFVVNHSGLAAIPDEGTGGVQQAD